MPLKIAATGLNGLVGSRIYELLQNTFTFIPLPQESFDITKKDTVFSALKNIDFDIFFHLAAYTNVDQAEIDKEKAYQVNVEGTKNVFEATKKLSKPFIYVSTGYVFDGKNPPFVENTPPNPVCYYGQTKKEAESIVKNEAMIVRIELPYRAEFSGKKDFARSLLSLLKEGKTLTMINDSLITPTFIDDIACSMSYLFTHYQKDIYHLVGSESLSPYDAALTIAEVFDIPQSQIKKTTYDEYMKSKAERPRYAKIISTKNIGYQMKSFREGLKEMKKQLI